MLSEKMIDAINAQVNEELYSFYLYLSMAEYYQESKLSGFASWMRAQAQEEMSHGMKFVHYLGEQNSRAVYKAIATPPKEWKSPLAAFEDSYKHEKHITGCINKLMDLAVELKDYASIRFLGWFIDEQIEEEGNVLKVLDQLEMVSKVPAGLFMIDRELAKRGAK
ncbi:MAG: ferritin [Candidatus Ozemobacteraceae bacterium]